MPEQRTRGAVRATKGRTARRAVSEPVKKGERAVRGPTSSAAEAAPTEALEDVQDQGQDAVGTTLEGAQCAAGNTLEQVAPGSRDQSTVREELAAIVRETAIEVLGPVVRNATKQAAKYAITRGPEVMARNVAPRVRETVGPAIEEAGGPGALARGALSKVSDKRAGLFSKISLGQDRGNGGSLPGTEGWRVPIEESVDVAASLETAYDQLSQFEDFAKLIAQGEKVDERPNERIEWKSSDGMEASGVITFHRLSDRLTRVMVTYDVQPQGILQKAVSALRMSGRALRTDLMRYKAFVEMIDEDEVAELGDRDDADELEPRRKRPAARRRPNEDAEETDEAYDEAEDDFDSDEEPEGDEEPDAPAPTVRRRAPARSGQKARQRR
jgi:hypothetical protein